ncbi:TIM-barrel domain-containing protein [Brackiella oedipodis]|uniref:TIM-barrel domain-containing protein n=1 Tax=Brackiella oedipodis TaxID=124225 RepID=UPI0004913F5E|nr:TIM-barrel domain-containing protein [Brackiella oedipodis]
MILFEQLRSLSNQSNFIEFHTNHPDYIFKVEASAPGVFRLRCGLSKHFETPSSRQKLLQELFLARPEAIGELQLTELEQAWQIEQGECCLQISKDNFELRFLLKNRLVLSTATHYDSAFAFDQDHWALLFNLQPQEPVYGLGATAQNFNRRTEQIVSDEAQFEYLPLAWSPQGWGVFVNSAGRSIHSVGTQEDTNSYQIQLQDQQLDLFVFVGDVAEVFNQFTALTGRSGQPSFAAMGLGLKQLPQQEEFEFIDLAEQCRQQGIPLDTLEFANPSLITFQADRLQLEFDSNRLEDNPRHYFDDLKNQDWHCVIPTFPGVLADTRLFEELEDRAWLLLGPDGLAYQFPGTAASGGKPFGLLDLTYKDALQFWRERHEQLFEQGQSCQLSFADVHIPDEVENRQGESGAVLRTLYPMLLEQSLYQALSAKSTPPEALVNRDFVAPMTQRTPWIQRPLASNDWQGIKQLYRQLLSLQASATTCVVHEFGHLQGGAFASKTYLRFLAFSVFSSNFTFMAKAELLPLQLDEQSRACAQMWLALRYRLMPYILGIIEDSVRTGLPVQRIMALAFPEDAQAAEFDEQYMFGPALLVAPILDDSDQKTLYLPAGYAWWDLNTGERYEGGQVITYECDTQTLPVFGLEGHMLSIGPDLKHLGEFNTARMLDEIWMFGRPKHNPAVMRNKIRVMQMQGSSYIKGLEGLKILTSEGLEVKRRGAEVRISPER